MSRLSKPGSAQWRRGLTPLLAECVGFTSRSSRSHVITIFVISFVIFNMAPSMNFLRSARQARGYAGQFTDISASPKGTLLDGSWRRRVSCRLRRRFTRVMILSTSTFLFRPPEALSADDLAALSRTRYPGFRHLAAGRKVNPAAVVAGALLSPELDARLRGDAVVELARYPDLEWDWLVGQAKLNDLRESSRIRGDACSASGARRRRCSAPRRGRARLRATSRPHRTGAVGGGHDERRAAMAAGESTGRRGAVACPQSAGAVGVCEWPALSSASLGIRSCRLWANGGPSHRNRTPWWILISELYGLTRGIADFESAGKPGRLGDHCPSGWTSSALAKRHRLYFDR